MTIARLLILAISGLMTEAQATAPLREALLGSWSGTLEYRDYQSDRRVTLPTTLVVASGDAGTLTFSYTYDDGPGKTVTSLERVSIDVDAGTYRVQADEGRFDTTYTSPALKGSGPASPAVVLVGKGLENDVTVEVRITLTVTASSLTMLRESRKPGAEWLFRNQYKFAR